MFQANAELLENCVLLSFVFLTAVDGLSLRWCFPDSAAGPGLLVRASAPPALAWRGRAVRLHLGSRRLGGVEMFTRDVMANSGTVRQTQQS